MPIKGLTENPRIPRLGKIKTGIKDPNRNGAPAVTHYFVVPPEVAAVHGAQPTELPIVFLSDDTEVIASQYYRAYNQTNGLICKGDGEHASALLDVAALTRANGDLTPPLQRQMWASSQSQQVRLTDITCLGGGYGDEPPCPMFVHKACRIRMFMQFAIAGVPGMGVYQLETGSLNSIRNINGTISLIKSLTGGRIAGLPLRLVRSSIRGTVNNKAQDLWILELRCDVPIADVMERLSGPVASALLLPPPDEIDLDQDDPEPEQEYIPPPPRQQAPPRQRQAPANTEPLDADVLRELIGKMQSARQVIPPMEISAFMAAMAERFTPNRPFSPNTLSTQQAREAIEMVEARIQAVTASQPSLVPQPGSPEPEE